MSESALSDLFVIWSTTIARSVFFSVEDHLWTSESDVHRVQILTSKDGPLLRGLIM